MRTYLSPGAVIELTCDDGATRKFQIDRVIGDGANCIAYEAHRTDRAGPARNYRIKECYPYGAQIERAEMQLNWANENERMSAFLRIRKAHDLIVELRNAEAVGNNITSAELCEGNGTLYSVMEVNHAKTYNKEVDSDLHGILETMLVLTKVVGSLHNQGYLHLDIKPSNFLVNHRPKTNIWLFDVDSLTSMEELKEGTVQATSFSQRWAAPEQIRGQADKLCPATDLFAIGAILFEKVMGRPVSNEDTGLFAEWDFDGELFENVNPKVKGILREIFKKTLSASVKRRYQSADELEKAFEQSVYVTSGVPYLQTESICSTIHFVGRDRELSRIDHAFRGGNRVVFLHGFRGLGKSELARVYAQTHSSDYDVMQLVMYGKEYRSISEWLENISIENHDSSGAERVRKAKSLMDDRTLIVIDNFNIKLGSDNGLSELLKTKAKILVTTTTDFSDIYREKSSHIEVGPISPEHLKELFEANSGYNLSAKEIPLFGELLSKIEHHTYFTDLLSRQMKASGATLGALYNEVCAGLATSSNPTQVVSNKDEVLYEETVANIMRTLFGIANLSDDHKQVLRNMCMLSFVKMTRGAYKEITSAPDFNAFNALVRLGYIQENGEVYSIHSLLEDLIRADMAPDWDSCIEAYNYVLETVNWFNSSLKDNKATRIEAVHKSRFLSAFFKRVDLSAKEHLKLLCMWFNYLANSPLTMTKAPWDKVDLNTLFDHCYKIAHTKQGDERLQILSTLFHACLTTVKFDISFDEGGLLDEQIIKHRHELIGILFNELWDTALMDGKETILGDLSEIVLASINRENPKDMLFRAVGLPVEEEATRVLDGKLLEMARKVHAYNPELYDLSSDGECTYYGNGWHDPKYRKYIKECNRALESGVASEDYDDIDDEDLLDPLDLYEESTDEDDGRAMVDCFVSDYKEAANKKLWIATMLRSEILSPNETINIIESILYYNFFHPFMYATQLEIDRTPQYARITKDEWDSVKELLDMAFDLIENQPDLKTEESDACDNLKCCKAIYLAYMDVPEFFVIANQMVEDEREHRDFFMQRYGERTAGPVDDVLYACWNIGKASYALPVLHSRIIGCKKDFSEPNLKQNYIQALYEDYEQLCKFSLKALESETLPEKIVAELQEILVWSAQCMDSITKKTFDLKEND